MQTKINLLSSYVSSKYGSIPSIPNLANQDINNIISNLDIRFKNSRKDYTLSDEILILFDEMRIYKVYSESFINTAKSNKQTLASLKVLKNNIKVHVNYISKKFGLLQDLDADILNDTNQILNTATSIIDNIQPLTIPEGDNSFSIKLNGNTTVVDIIKDINKDIAVLKKTSKSIASITKAVEKKAAIVAAKDLAGSLVAKIGRNTLIGSEGLALGLYLSAVVDLYDAIDIGTSICESLYKHYNVSTTLSQIEKLINDSTIVITKIKSDVCLRNTDFLTLKKDIKDKLITSINGVLAQERAYIGAINSKDETNKESNIAQKKNNLDSRIESHNGTTLPNAQREINSKCQENPDESNCIKVAREDFNKYRKPVKLIPNGNCVVYRRGDLKDSNFTPRNKPPTFWETWSTDTSILRAFIDPNVKRVQIINVSSPSFSFPLVAILDGIYHVSVVTSNGIGTGIDTSKMIEWASTRLTPNVHPLTTQLKLTRTGEIPKP